VRKKLIKNSKLFVKKFQKTVEGDFLTHTVHHSDHNDSHQKNSFLMMMMMISFYPRSLTYVMVFLVCSSLVALPCHGTSWMLLSCIWQ